MFITDPDFVVAGGASNQTREGRLSRMVGARGFDPVVPITRIIVPDWVITALRGIA